MAWERMPDWLLDTTTDADRTLNAVHNGFDAGRTVTYHGSLEDFRGCQVVWMDRCDCERSCWRQQATVVVVRDSHHQLLLHVAPDHLRLANAVEQTPRRGRR